MATPEEFTSHLLAQQIAVTILERLFHPETLVEFQAHVSSLMDAYVGMTSSLAKAIEGNGRNQPQAMEVDQVEVQSLIQRPFKHDLSQNERESLTADNRWFCCRQKGFSSKKIRQHQASCKDYKQWKSSRSKAVAAVSSSFAQELPFTSDSEDSDRYSLPTRSSSSSLTTSRPPALTIKKERQQVVVEEERSGENGIHQQPEVVPQKKVSFQVSETATVHEAVNDSLAKLTFQVRMGQDKPDGQFLVLVDTGAQVNVIRK